MNRVQLGLEQEVPKRGSQDKRINHARRQTQLHYIEMFYNVKRRHGFNNQLSPVEFEKRYAMSLQGV